MKILFTLLFLVIFASTLRAQCPHNGDVHLDSQEDVDNYFTGGGCPVIIGDLVIGSSVENLKGLNGIVNVDGTIYVSYTQIKSFEGLETLTNVTWGFLIEYNWALESLTGLDSLESTFAINIQACPIKSLAGLGRLAHLNSLSIRDCEAFESMAGLYGIVVMPGSISISNCAILTNFNGLESLYSVSGLHLADNPALEKVSAGSTLTKVDQLYFQNCPKLTNIQGLENLSEVSSLGISNTGLSNLDHLAAISSLSSLSISGNAELINIAGLSSVKSPLTYGRIINNANLSNCAVQAICTFLAQPDAGGAQLLISGNKAACENKDAVQTACEVILPVSLIAFTANKEVDKIDLFWQTAEERQSDFFEIQYSRDGSEWRAMERIPAQGTSLVKQQYSYTHLNPGVGLHYYRLRMVDKDETFAYSRIQHAYIHGLATNVFPNPASSHIDFAGTDWEKVERIQLMNRQGQAVFDATSLPNSRLDTANLPSGSYVLKVSRKDSGSQSTTIAIVH